MNNADKNKSQMPRKNTTLKPSVRIKIYHVGWLIALALYGPHTPYFFQWSFSVPTYSFSMPPWALPGLPGTFPMFLVFEILLFKWIGWSKPLPEPTYLIVTIAITLFWAAGLFGLSRLNRKAFWVGLVASAAVSSFFSFVMLGGMR